MNEPQYDWSNDDGIVRPICHHIWDGRAIKTEDGFEKWTITCGLCGLPYPIIEPKIEIQINRSINRQIKAKKIRENKELNNPPEPNIDNFYHATSGTFLEIDKVPDGFTSFFKSGSESEYFTNWQRTELVRVSNHWGRHIRFCDWFLYGYKHISCRKWNKLYGNRVRIGFIKINALYTTAAAYHKWIKHNKNKIA